MPGSKHQYIGLWYGSDTKQGTKSNATECMSHIQLPIAMQQGWSNVSHMELMVVGNEIYIPFRNLIVAPELKCTHHILV